MADTIGKLVVALDLVASPFERGLKAASKQADSFQKSLKKFSESTLGSVLSFAALEEGIRRSMDAAREFETATNALSASAKLAGQDLGTLTALVEDARSKFKLSKTTATEFGIEISKLADKTGGLKDPARVLESFLDVGASRGLSAAQSLEALRAAVKGSDDGIQALINRKPDQLFNDFATAVGTTAGALSEQGKEQAVVNAVLAEGASVRGEYQKWLQTTDGIQFQLSQGMTDAATVIGESFQPAFAALIPVFNVVADGLKYVGFGITAVIADVQEIPGLVHAIGQAISGDFAGAQSTMNATLAQWDATIARAKALSQSATAGLKSPGALGGRGTGGIEKSAGTGGQQADILRNDAIEKAKAQNALDVQRLGAEASLTDKLALELELHKRIYDIKKQSILADTRLSPEQKQNELLKAKLEKENADFSATGSADIEQQNKLGEAAKKLASAKIKTISDAVGGTIGALASGHGMSGAQIGQNVGMLAGAFIPVLEPFAAGIGGFLGGLFDKKKKQDEQQAQPIVKGLDAIERAQRDTITAIQGQTQQLLAPNDRFLNLPSFFNVPQYRPGLGGTLSMPTLGSPSGLPDFSPNVAVTVNVTTNASPQQVKKAVVDALGEAMNPLLGEMIFAQRRVRSRG